jgi:plastocyanin
MPKTLAPVLTVLGLLIAGAMPLMAQEPPPTPQELTLHPGDTIKWTPGPNHGVQFGDVPGVAPFATVQAILDLTPPLTANPPGVGKAGKGNPLTATVRTSATVGATFNFTCSEHNDMITLPFTIAAAGPGVSKRDVEIVAAGPPRRWILKSTPDKKLGP